MKKFLCYKLALASLSVSQAMAANSNPFLAFLGVYSVSECRCTKNGVSIEASRCGIKQFEVTSYPQTPAIGNVAITRVWEDSYFVTWLNTFDRTFENGGYEKQEISSQGSKALRTYQVGLNANNGFKHEVTDQIEKTAAGIIFTETDNQVSSTLESYQSSCVFALKKQK